MGGDEFVAVLIRQADQAMYQAKVAGKNRYCVFGVPPEHLPKTSGGASMPEWMIFWLDNRA